MCSRFLLVCCVFTTVGSLEASHNHTDLHESLRGEEGTGSKRDGILYNSETCLGFFFQGLLKDLINMRLGQCLLTREGETHFPVLLLKGTLCHQGSSSAVQWLECGLESDSPIGILALPPSSCGTLD